MTLMNRKTWIRLAIGALLVAGVWRLVRCQCVSLKAFTPADIKVYIQGFGRLAPAIYVIAYALNTISIVPPIAILSLAAGLVFGKVWGAVFLMTGAMLGTSATFFISRIFGRAIVDKVLKGKFRNLDEALGRRGFATILFFRIVPIVPYEPLNYTAGLSKIKFRDYFLATFIGLIPGVVISAFFGGTIGELGSLKDLFSVKFVTALGLLTAIILVPVIYQYLKKKKGA